MKTFIASVVLFISMVVIIITNSVYINKTADILTQMIADLPHPECTDCNIYIKDLKKYWESNYPLISLSVSLNDLNKISDSIAQLSAYSLNNNNQDFEATQKLLINAIKNLRRLEQISLDSIM